MDRLGEGRLASPPSASEHQNAAGRDHLLRGFALIKSFFAPSAKAGPPFHSLPPTQEIVQKDSRAAWCPTFAMAAIPSYSSRDSAELAARPARSRKERAG